MINIYKEKISFLKHYKKFYFFSLILVSVSIFSYFTKGLNLGIDFKGGTIIEMQFNDSLSSSKIRSSLIELNLGDVKVKEFGDDKTFLAILEKKSGESNFISEIKSSLEKKIK